MQDAWVLQKPGRRANRAGKRVHTEAGRARPFPTVAAHIRYQIAEECCRPSPPAPPLCFMRILFDDDSLARHDRIAQTCQPGFREDHGSANRSPPKGTIHWSWSLRPRFLTWPRMRPAAEAGLMTPTNVSALWMRPGLPYSRNCWCRHPSITCEALLEEIGLQGKHSVGWQV